MKFPNEELLMTKLLGDRAEKLSIGMQHLQQLINLNYEWLQWSSYLRSYIAMSKTNSGADLGKYKRLGQS